MLGSLRKQKLRQRQQSLKHELCTICELIPDMLIRMRLSSNASSLANSSDEICLTTSKISMKSSKVAFRYSRGNQPRELNPLNIFVLMRSTAWAPRYLWNVMWSNKAEPLNISFIVRIQKRFFPNKTNVLPTMVNERIERLPIKVWATAYVVSCCSGRSPSVLESATFKASVKISVFRMNSRTSRLPIEIFGQNVTLHYLFLPLMQDLQQMAEKQKTQISQGHCWLPKRLAITLSCQTIIWRIFSRASKRNNIDFQIKTWCWKSSYYNHDTAKIVSTTN